MRRRHPIRVTFIFLSFVALLALMLGSAHAAAAGTATVATPSARYALAAPSAQFMLRTEAVNRDAELRADLAAPKSFRQRYAVQRAIAGARFDAHHAQGGEWRDLADGMALWRIPVQAPNALSLDFGFPRFFLPPGAQLFIHNDGQTLGPYTDADNPRSHQFWTPLLAGDSALIEVLVPKAMKPFLDIELGVVHAGYRNPLDAKSLKDPSTSSGTCNVDSICPQADNWRGEVNAVAALVSSGFYCSGQLVNNTARDNSPLLLTAHHCFDTQNEATGLVVYWKYESPTCRAVGGMDNAQPISTAAAIAQTGGATLLATEHDSDFSLFRLNTPPPQSAQVYFDGWDRSENAFSNAAVFHHPASDAKRVSLAAGTVVVDETDYGLDSTGHEEVPGLHHWLVDHYAAGTTEGGSSGGGLLDSLGHLRGVLSGGSASCSETDGFDGYGRISSAWQGAGSADSRLSDWLDPQHTGVTTLDGAASCSLSSVSLNFSANPTFAGNKITISATASGGTPPYRYAFDVDDDGITDSTDPSQSTIPAVYPDAYSGNVRVSVNDGAGCVGSATRALVVQAPKIALASLPTPVPQLLCGGSASGIQPGQRWRLPIGLINNGNAASQPGYAIFAQSPSSIAQTKLTIETPSLAVPALAPGQSAVVNLDYAIDADNTCSAPVTIALVGATDGRNFSTGQTNVVDTAIASSCQAITTCAAVTTPIQLSAGSYYDALRPGNGMTLLTVPQSGADSAFFGLWFTADAQRQPLWYQVQAPLHANQVNSALYQNQQTVPPTWPATPHSIGSAQITQVAADEFVFSWNFNGNAGGALYTPVTTIPSSIRLWYNPSENGWGLYDQLAQVGGATAPPLIFTLAYIYDSVGTPRWLQGNNSSYTDGATLDAISVRPACPGCVWLDYTAGEQNAGTLVYTGSGANVQISTNLFFPSAIPGSWTRSQFPLTPLYLSP